MPRGTYQARISQQSIAISSSTNHIAPSDFSCIKGNVIDAKTISGRNGPNTFYVPSTIIPLQLKENLHVISVLIFF